MTYKDIFKKHNITLSDLKKIINQYKLTRNKSELYKGNQNAKNNKGGKGATSNNNNAVVTGEYEKIYKNMLTEDEWALYKNYKINDNDELQMQKYISPTICPIIPLPSHGLGRQNLCCLCIQPIHLLTPLQKFIQAWGQNRKMFY